MITFPTFFLVGFLSEAGWPRRSGVLRKEMMEARALDGAVIQLQSVGAALGGGRPELAARLLADVFANRDWSRNTLDMLAADLRAEFPRSGRTYHLPHITLSDESLDPRRQRSHLIPWDLLGDAKFSALVHWHFAIALWWGLEHPDKVRRDIDGELSAATRAPSSLTRASIISLSPGGLPSDTQEYFADAEAIVTMYDEAGDGLAPLPAEFRASPVLAKRFTLPDQMASRGSGATPFNPTSFDRGEFKRKPRRGRGW